MRFLRPSTLVLAAALAGAAAAQTSYTVRDLDALLPAGATAYGTQVYDVNRAGDFVGSFTIAGGPSNALRATQPFVYHGGAFTAIPSVVPTDPNSRVEDHAARAINESGMAVGDYTTDAVHGYGTGFVWQNGVLTSVAGGVTGITDVNDAGLAVAGENYVQDGILVPIPVLDSVSWDESAAINNQGHIAGIAANLTYAGLYDGTNVTLSPNLLAFGGGSYSRTVALNDADLVVGNSIFVDPYGGTTAQIFVWDGATVQRFGSPYAQTYAADLNDAGVIVGTYGDGGGAFSLENGVFANLNDRIAGSGWTMLSAQAISENGRIVGSARDAAGNVHSVMLNPVPEPVSLAALGLGAVGLLRRRKAARKSSIGRLRAR